jgi:hypothetical protein
MSVGWIERLRSNGLEPQCSHHGIEEDLEENHVVSVCCLHDLHPLDRHLVLGAIVLCVVDRELGTLTETVDTSSPVNEKL